MKEQRYPAAILDGATGPCYRSYEFVIFLNADVHISGRPYSSKQAARSAAVETAIKLDLEIYWKRR